MNEAGIDRPEDEELVRRYQVDPAGPAGREAASMLFERYREPIYLWFLRRVRDPDRALDLAQEALVSAYRALGAFEGRSRYATWLYTIARHRWCRDCRPTGIWLDDSVETDGMPSGVKSPDLRLEEQEDEDALLDLIRKELEPDEQLAIWLRCVENWPVGEITRRLQIQTASGARGLLQTARRKLSAALSRKGGRWSR